jgi:putative MFS transporter
VRRGASIVTVVAGSIYAKYQRRVGAEIVLGVGFVPIAAIYVQTAILFGVYTPELFPTAVRLRANDIWWCS